MLEEHKRGGRLRGRQLFDQVYYHQVEIPPDTRVLILNESSTNHDDDRDDEETKAAFQEFNSGDCMGTDCE